LVKLNINYNDKMFSLLIFLFDNSFTENKNKNHYKSKQSAGLQQSN